MRNRELGLADAACVTRARVLATALPDDAANVFITLSAPSLNAPITIIARGEKPCTERKLLHIGPECMAGLILLGNTGALRQTAALRQFERVLPSLGFDLDLMTTAPGSPAVSQTIAGPEAAAQGAFLIVQETRRHSIPMLERTLRVGAPNRGGPRADADRDCLTVPRRA